MLHTGIEVLNDPWKKMGEDHDLTLMLEHMVKAASHAYALRSHQLGAVLLNLAAAPIVTQKVKEFENDVCHKIFGMLIEFQFDNVFKGFFKKVASLVTSPSLTL
jgi:hypothetical protein